MCRLILIYTPKVARFVIPIASTLASLFHTVQVRNFFHILESQNYSEQRMICPLPPSHWRVFTSVPTSLYQDRNTHKRPGQWNSITRELMALYFYSPYTLEMEEKKTEFYNQGKKVLFIHNWFGLVNFAVQSLFSQWKPLLSVKHLETLWNGCSTLCARPSCSETV